MMEKSAFITSLRWVLAWVIWSGERTGALLISSNLVTSFFVVPFPSLVQRTEPRIRADSRQKVTLSLSEVGVGTDQSSGLWRQPLLLALDDIITSLTASLFVQPLQVTEPRLNRTRDEAGRKERCNQLHGHSITFGSVNTNGIIVCRELTASCFL